MRRLRGLAMAWEASLMEGHELFDILVRALDGQLTNDERSLIDACDHPQQRRALVNDGCEQCCDCGGLLA